MVVSFEQPPDKLICLIPNGSLATMLEEYYKNPQLDVWVNVTHMHFTHEAITLANTLYLFQGKTGVNIYFTGNLRVMLEGARPDQLCGDWQLSYRVLRGTLSHKALIEERIHEATTAIDDLQENVKALSSLSRAKKVINLHVN